jgi:hypothetical protein
MLLKSSLLISLCKPDTVLVFCLGKFTNFLLSCDKTKRARLSFFASPAPPPPFTAPPTPVPLVFPLFEELVMIFDVKPSFAYCARTFAAVGRKEGREEGRDKERKEGESELKEWRERERESDEIKFQERNERKNVK